MRIFKYVLTPEPAQVLALPIGTIILGAQLLETAEPPSNIQREFSYEAIDRRSGQSVTGSVNAPSADAAVAKLEDMGYGGVEVSGVELDDEARTSPAPELKPVVYAGTPDAQCGEVRGAVSASGDPVSVGAEDIDMQSVSCLSDGEPVETPEAIDFPPVAVCPHHVNVEVFSLPTGASVPAGVHFLGTLAYPPSQTASGRQAVFHVFAAENAGVSFAR